MTITIQFFGICVNFQTPIIDEQTLRHRVVLPNASAGVNIQGQLIVPHFASLLATEGILMVGMALPGCTLSIANAIEGDCVYSQTYDCIPNLSQLVTLNTGTTTLSASSKADYNGISGGVSTIWCVMLMIGRNFGSSSSDQKNTSVASGSFAPGYPVRYRAIDGAFCST